MKLTANGKRYCGDRCELLGSTTHYHNGNISGESFLLRANDGELLVETHSNGQNLYLRGGLRLMCDSSYTIEDFDFSDDQELRCAELGLFEIV